MEEQQIRNPYRYNGERIDDIAGVPAFQYLRARYLDLYTGTFTTQDTYLGSLLTPLSQNRYTYAHNNPVMYTDPSGHFLNILIGAGAGAVISTAVSIGSSLLTGEKIDIKKVGVSALTGAASGALMATGLPIPAVALGNAGISMLGNALEQKIDIDREERKEFDTTEMFFDGGVSLVSTFLFYKPEVPRHLISQEKNLFKQIFKNKKPVGKALKYFWSQVKNDLSNMVTEQLSPKEFLSEFTDSYLVDKLKDEAFNREGYQTCLA